MHRKNKIINEYINLKEKVCKFNPNTYYLKQHKTQITL